MLKYKITSKQRGLGLVELMVSISVSLLLMTSISSTLISTLRTNVETVKTTRLHQELHIAMLLIVNNIRRAGTYANASNDVGTNTNTNPFINITINANNCIEFSYDMDNDGSLNTATELLGFRLNSTEGTIESRPNGSLCTVAWDSNTDIEDLTDKNVTEITNLTFTDNSNTIEISDTNLTDLPPIGTGSNATITVREIEIVLQGRLRNDSAIVRELRETVRVRNDLFIPAT